MRQSSSWDVLQYTGWNIEGFIATMRYQEKIKTLNGNYVPVLEKKRHSKILNVCLVVFLGVFW